MKITLEQAKIQLEDMFKVGIVDKVIVNGKVAYQISEQFAKELDIGTGIENAVTIEESIEPFKITLTKEENKKIIDEQRAKCKCDKDCYCNCINCRCILKRKEAAVTMIGGQHCTEKA